MPHNFPKWHRLYQPAEEFIAADAAFVAMGKVGVGPIEDLERSWSQFLIHIERVWSKLSAAGKGLSGWQAIESDVAGRRRSDPLLRYVHHARNAGEHTIQEFSLEWNGPLEAADITTTGFTLSWPPWDRPLLPIMDRGVRYEPPTEHLGQDIRDQFGKGMPQPFVVARLALQFYLAVLQRANSEVSWPQADT